MPDFAKGMAGEGAKGEVAGAAKCASGKDHGNERVVNAAAVDAMRDRSGGEEPCAGSEDMGITKAAHEGLDTGSGLIQVQT